MPSVDPPLPPPSPVADPEQPAPAVTSSLSVNFRMTGRHAAALRAVMAEDGVSLGDAIRDLIDQGSRARAIAIENATLRCQLLAAYESAATAIAAVPALRNEVAALATNLVVVWEDWHRSAVHQVAATTTIAAAIDTTAKGFTTTLSATQATITEMRALFQGIADRVSVLAALQAAADIRQSQHLDTLNTVEIALDTLRSVLYDADRLLSHLKFQPPLSAAPASSPSPLSPDS